MSRIDVSVVGSGPNGLAAAVMMARRGLSVRVYEKAASVGGGTRSAELTLPGFRHDVCSAIHPQALASAFFRAFGLTDRVEFIVPEASYAHPLPGREAGVAYQNLQRTAEHLGRDGAAWTRLFRPLLNHANGVLDVAGGPLLRVPRDLLGAMRLGVSVTEQGSFLAGLRFRDDVAPALLTGVMAHASTSLPSLAGAGVGLVLALQGHAVGWGFPVGGSQAIADALVDDLVAHGGEVVLDHEITTLRQVEDSAAVMLDISPRAFEKISHGTLPARYRRSLHRLRYGSGVAKVDFALSDPVPWADPTVRQAATVHLGGTRADIARAENAVHAGRHAEEPFVLVSQPSLFDTTRAPAGKHVLWAYMHVPAGSDLDPTEAITSRIEQFAPGFRDTVLATASMTAQDFAAYNPNYIGGSISGGHISIPQLIKRPVASRAPWRTPLRGVYLCSASTPPGPAVHGMCGWYAARLALREIWGIHEANPNRMSTPDSDQEQSMI